MTFTPPTNSSQAAEDRDPFEELASEFAERQRRGEMPSLEEYARAHPDLADEIRELFPTIAAMEQLKHRKATPSRPMMGGMPLDQLGDFRIIGEIGRGGMGVVFEAEQVSLGRHVAVKVLPRQALLDQRHLRRFEREAQTAAKLHHTNIVPVFGVGQQDDYHYIVMQFIPGVGLDEVLVALRHQVLGDGTPIENDSSRASHANHNAKALLTGQFDHAHPGGYGGSLIRRDSSSDAVPPSGIVAATTSGVLKDKQSPIVRPRQAPTVAIDATRIGSRDDVGKTTEISDGGGEDAKSTSSPLDYRRIGGPYYQSVAKIGVQVADALRYAHEQGTLHRDIKPGNLLLDHTGTVWVADFGLAKFTEHDNVSHTGDIVGTLAYMAPESLSGETDARSDVYSLGLTLYEMLVLRPAFLGRDRGKLVRQISEGHIPPPRRWNPNIPRDLETIVLKAIALQPTDRYTSARELADDLQCYLSDMPIAARRASVPERLWRWGRRNRLVAALTASVLSLLILVAAVSSIGWYRVQMSEANEIVQRRKAEANFGRAIEVLVSTFDRLAPNRLPISADTTLQSSGFDSTDATLELLNDSQPQTVAPPPVTSEMVALLIDTLERFDDIIQEASNLDALRLVSADLTLRVGKSLAILGRADEATKYTKEAINKYQAELDTGGKPAAAVGLAEAYNELGSTLTRSGGREKHEEALAVHRQALELLRQQEEKIQQQSPRARYELARTLFLMSVRPFAEESGMFRNRGRGPGGRGNPMGIGPGGGGFNSGLGGGPGGRPSPGPDRNRDEFPGPPPNELLGGPPGPQRFGGTPPDRRPLDDPRRRENDLQSQANLQEAIEVLEKLVKDDPLPEYRYLLARCQMGLSWMAPQRRKAYTDSARTLLEDLVRENPNVGEYRFELAVVHALSAGRPVGDSSQDIEVCRKVVELLDRLVIDSPGVAHYAKVRIFAFMRLGATLQEVARKQPNDPSLLSAAVSAFQRGDEAMQWYQERFRDEAQRELVQLVGIRRQFADQLAQAGAIADAVSIYQKIVADLQRDLTPTEAPPISIPRRQTVAIRRAHLEASLELAKLLERDGKSTQRSSLLASTEKDLQSSIDELKTEYDRTPLNSNDRDQMFRDKYDMLDLLVQVYREQGNMAAATQLGLEAATELVGVREAERVAGTGSVLELIEAKWAMVDALRRAGRDDEARQLLLDMRTTAETFRRSQPQEDGGDFRVRFRRFQTARLLKAILEELGETEGIQELEQDLSPLRGGGRGRNRGSRPSEN